LTKSWLVKPTVHHFCGLESLGRSNEALFKFEEALTMFSRVLPTEDDRRICIAEIGRGTALVDLERHEEANGVLSPVWKKIAVRADVPKKYKLRCLEALVKVFESLEAIEPGQGHAEKITEWRSKLDQLQH